MNLQKAKKWGATALMIVAPVLGATAMAQDPVTLDTLATEAVATAEGLKPVLITVGTAIISLAAVAMAIRWIKATFF